MAKCSDIEKQIKNEEDEIKILYNDIDDVNRSEPDFSIAEERTHDIMGDITHIRRKIEDLERSLPNCTK